MKAGIVEKLNGVEIRDWIKDGSEQEDEPIYALRYLKHFYNPLDGSGLGIFNSSYVWANDYYANEWSWRAARSKYYTGLTATTDTERKSALADSFRSIGQVMHLVQDMASVAHTRNDAHGIYDGFETYTKENIDSLNYSAYNFANALTSVSQYAPRQFWDSDTYTGSNPSANNTQGLAEYTNANFFSDDTINAANFPFPRITNETPIVAKNFHNSLWNTTYPRQYYLKNCCGETNGSYGYLLAAVDYLDYYRQQYPWLSYGLSKKPVLDDNVYKDYSDLLLPRAVGYSAGLLNYFFRGKVNMEKDPQNAGKYIIKNEYSEKMEGTFVLYYDDASGNRNAVPGASWTLTINPNSTSSPVTFTEPTSPAPKEKGKYILVFNGKLGMEEGAVVGREIKLVTVEPKYSISIKALGESYLISGFDRGVGGDYWQVGLGNWKLSPEMMLTGVKDSVTLEISVSESTGTAPLNTDVSVSIEPPNQWTAKYYGTGTLSETFVRTNESGKAEVTYTKGNESTGIIGLGYTSHIEPEWKIVELKANLSRDERISSTVGLRYRDPLSISYNYYYVPRGCDDSNLELIRK